MCSTAVQSATRKWIMKREGWRLRQNISIRHKAYLKKKKKCQIYLCTLWKWYLTECLRELSAFYSPLKYQHCSCFLEGHWRVHLSFSPLSDNTAGIVARRSTFTRKDRTQYLLPVVVTDSGSPALSSTSTLTVSVCSCHPAGHCPSGGVEALALSMGVSLQTLLGFLVCLVTLTGKACAVSSCFHTSCVHNVNLNIITSRKKREKKIKGMNSFYGA